jgi:RNA recognition motif-containing protein
MTKLFVVGIPRDMDQTELIELFTLHGVVDMVTIITDKDTGQSQGYGFIHMNDEAGAKRAITALNGATIDDRTITVRIADDKREPQPAPEKSKRPRKSYFPAKRH